MFVSAQREIPSTAVARLETTRFLSGLLRGDTWHRNQAFDEVMQSWIVSLPQLLWQLRFSVNAGPIRIIVDIFVAAVVRWFPQRPSASVSDSSNLLEKVLVPLFLVTVPGKGDILGPFIRQPDDVQRQLLGLVFAFGVPKEKLAKAIAACCNGGFPSSVMGDVCA